MTEPASGSTWSEHLTALHTIESIADEAVAVAGEDVRDDVYLSALRSLAQFTLLASADGSHPELVPAAGGVFDLACPNPDFVVTTSPLTPGGVYRLSGDRGSTHFVTVTIRGAEIVEFDLDDCTIGDDGSFAVVLSESPPDDRSADWRRLPSSASIMAIRQAAYGPDEVDGRFSIERLDLPVRPDRLSPPSPASQLEFATQMAPGYVRMWLHHVVALRERGMVNRLELDDWADRGGVAGQWYFQGVFELHPGDVLLLDTEVPEPCRYWNVQLSDLLWNAIDPVRYHAAINGAQARIDADGRFRAVVSPVDPGVPNWLDTGGRLRGTVLGRWNGVSDPPLPQVRVVPFDEVRTHLPGDTPVVTAGERDDAMRQRLRTAQRRVRW